MGGIGSWLWRSWRFGTVTQTLWSHGDFVRRRRQREIYARARRADELVNGVPRQAVLHRRMMPCQR